MSSINLLQDLTAKIGTLTNNGTVYIKNESTGVSGSIINDGTMVITLQDLTAHIGVITNNGHIYIKNESTGVDGGKIVNDGTITITLI